MDDIESRADDAARSILVGALDNPTTFSVTGFIEQEWLAVTEDQRERFLGNLASALAIRCVGALLAVEQLDLVTITGQPIKFDALATMLHGYDEGGTDD